MNIKINLSDKLTDDILWNFVSFMIVGVMGVVLNIFILSVYGAAALGLFNQIYAIFIVLSQIAVNGIHFSVLKSVSLSGAQPEQARILTSALILTGLVSVTVIGLVLPLGNLASILFDSPHMTLGIKLVLPGLFFFTLNKVILAFLNGQRRMKIFAVFQAIRSILMVIFLLLQFWLIHDENTVSAIFSFSEGVLFLCLLPVIYKNISFRFDRGFVQSAVQHFKYGLKATGGNILLELNTKLDVLILGLFVTDREVGIYSFAALFIEGFMQLPVIIRNNINPLLAIKYHQDNLDNFKAFVKKVIRYSYLIFIPLSVIGMLLFPIVGLIKTDVNIHTAWLYFVIMLAGMLVASGYLPLLMTFNQAGKPGTQSLVLLSTTIALVVSVWLLTMYFGPLGAALGVSLTYAIQAGIIGFTLRKIEKRGTIFEVGTSRLD